MINFFKKIDQHIYLFAFIALIVLWRLLLPGYVLTLDMVFGPYFKPLTLIGVNSAVFLNLFIATLNFLLPMWLIQKIILFSLIFCLGYLPYRFFPVPKNTLARVWLGLFYLFNPFVYERFLAGQWMLLFAYAFLPLIFYFLKKLFADLNFISALKLAGALFLIANFSPHFFVIACFVIAVWFFVELIKILFEKKSWQKPILAIVYFIVLSLILNGYWLYSSLQNQSAWLGEFDSAHFDAFVTAADSRLGAIGNVALLYGFWGEHEPWIENFWLPKNNSFILLVGGLSLLLLFILGVWNVWRKERVLALSFLFFTASALVLSLGQAASPFNAFNSWIFDNIFFYAGFRDTQKWSGLLAASYAFFGAWGVYALVNFLPKKIAPTLVGAAMLMPLVYSCAMPGGFGHQLESVWYPDSWQEAENFLQENAGLEEKILFLPWHQYLTFDFNQNRLIANPAELFFSVNLVIGQSPEIGNVGSSGDVLHKNLNYYILNKEGSAEIKDFLLQNNIIYVILANDLTEIDPYKYEFLYSSDFSKIWERDRLTIYKIVLR